MKALKDCKWEITILSLLSSGKYYWAAQDNNYDSGLADDLTMDDSCATEEEAINNWKKFAELNGITDYKIVEN